MAANLSLTILGARGSMPVAGPDFIRFGGKTTSFVISAASTSLILDCGTGIVDAVDLDVSGRWHILLSHYHHDHLQGLHFFKPLYSEGNEFTFYGLPPDGLTLEETISATFAPPFFPIALEETPSTHRFVELSEGVFSIGDIDIDVARLHHPQGVAGYRFMHGGKSIVVATDHEAGDEQGDAAFAGLVEDADVLIHDAQYTSEDYEPHRGWGHSTWGDAVDTARQLGVKRLILTSHDPSRTDTDIEAIVGEARRRFPLVSAAHEGMRVSV
jgi:phosphoribosyl 1,2-cyclic phosphodiesterase